MKESERAVVERYFRDSGTDPKDWFLVCNQSGCTVHYFDETGRVAMIFIGDDMARRCELYLKERGVVFASIQEAQLEFSRRHRE